MSKQTDGNNNGELSGPCGSALIGARTSPDQYLSLKMDKRACIFSDLFRLKDNIVSYSLCMTEQM